MSRTWRRWARTAVVAVVATAAAALSVSGAGAAVRPVTDRTTGLDAPGCTGAELWLSTDPAQRQPPVLNDVSGWLLARGGCLPGTTIHIGFFRADRRSEPVVVNRASMTTGPTWDDYRLEVGAVTLPERGGFVQVNLQTCYQGVCGPTHFTRLDRLGMAFTRGSQPPPA